MNREVKFRIWDIDSETMQINGLSFDDIETLRYSLDGFEDYFGRDYLKDNPNCLMQFTGMKDKEKSEIYEEDIVEVYGYKRGLHWEDDEGHHYTITGVVRFMPSKGFCIKIYKMHDTDNDLPMKFSPYGYITQSSSLKLGNKFENPELLK